MKSTKADETAKNLDDIISSMPWKPGQFASDAGSEFHPKNPSIHRVLVEKYGMAMFILKEPMKASMVERAIRTLKTRIARYMTENKTKNWVDVLQELAEAINNTKHRSTGMAPNEINFDNRKTVFKKLYGSRTPPIDCKFSVGDVVRLPEKKNIFDKGYAPNWTKELFKISHVKSDGTVCYYNVTTIGGEKIEKNYYDSELNLVIKNAVHKPK